MAFTTTSKYVQLSPYLVMEYMYASPPNPEEYFVNVGSPTVGYNRLVNGILKDSDGQVSNDAQIFNLDENASITQNTSNNSVVQTNLTTFVTLNPNLIVPYNDFKSELTDTANLPISFSSNLNVVYDSVRYHILAGYNLDNLDGLILNVKYPDVDGSYVTFSQIKLSKGNSQQYTLNPNPLTIGANIYDKYFEVKIPSLSDMINKYNAASPSNKPLTLAAKTSKSGRGFLAAQPLRVNAYSITDTSVVSGYETYGTQLLAALSLEPTDPFNNIGAYISPADTGDFFEYFGTDDGGFIEDFILFQNSIGNSYYIENRIEVLEQVGAAWLETSNFISIQTSAYDVPNLFRPIVRYSNVATSFSLRYTMTLINSKDQTRIMRVATYTSTDPGKYGSTITPLQLSVLPQQQKIYNKLAGKTDISVPFNQMSPREITKFANVFVDRNLVNTSLTNLDVNGTNITERSNSSSPSISYGIGKAYIRVSPFDNYYKFSFFRKGPDGTTQEIDLSSSGTYNMVFINNMDKKVYAPSIADANIAKPSKGELAFKVDESISNQILQFTNRKFYITNKPPDPDGDNTDTRGISKVNKTKSLLAKRAVSLRDSSRNIILASKKDSNTSRAVNTAKIGGNSFSTLYWGNWLKDDEKIPVQTTLEAEVKVIPTSPVFKAPPNKPGKSSWQVSGIQSGNLGTSGDGKVSKGGSNSSQQKLSQAQLKSAISSDVQGKVATGWSTPEIISYFLDPSSAGYKLYVGITKELFIQAVQGIFGSGDMSLVFAYGNTGAGRTTGGSASSNGGTANQSGSDNGSSLPNPKDVIIDPDPGGRS
jgi:hypothetical protein